MADVRDSQQKTIQIIVYIILALYFKETIYEIVFWTLDLFFSIIRGFVKLTFVLSLIALASNPKPDSFKKRVCKAADRQGFINGLIVKFVTKVVPSALNITMKNCYFFTLVYHTEFTKQPKLVSIGMFGLWL